MLITWNSNTAARPYSTPVVPNDNGHSTNFYHHNALSYLEQDKKTSRHGSLFASLLINDNYVFNSSTKRLCRVVDPHIKQKQPQYEAVH